MRNNNLLLISPFFYPELISTGKYNAWLVKALIKKGLSVDVITSHPFYPEWRPKKSDAGLGSVRVHRSGAWIRYPGSQLWRRLVLECWFSVYVLWKVFRLRKKIDTVIAIFPPNFFSLFLPLILTKNTKLIGIVHDLQGIFSSRGKSPERKIASIFVKAFERRAIVSCDKVIFLSRSMFKRAQKAYGIPGDKVQVFYPFTTIDGNDQDEDKLASIFKNGFKHVVYSGALGEKQDPLGLFNLFEHVVKKRDDVICHVFSNGPYFEKLVSLGNTNLKILFHDLVEEKLLHELYRRSDLQVIINQSWASDGAFPSKVPNLIKMGVPIFAVCDRNSELAKIILESGIGRVSEGDSDLLVQEISDFLDTSSEKTHKARSALTRDFVESNFNINSLIEEIAALDTKQTRH